MLTIALAALCLSGCEAPVRAPQADRSEKVGDFPTADRPVATIVSDRWSTEEARDRVDEAETVMDLAGIKPGMTVADIGAGEGYYTIRLASRVGKDGRVLAQDIVPGVRDALAERVARDGLDNVSVRLGEPQDPKLPANSFDRVLMVHMYHEIASPYEFLWRLHPSLRAGGEVVVVDANRATQNHGTPPALLKCEFEAVGYRQVRIEETRSAGGYMAVFRADRPRPAPDAIRGCRVENDSPQPANAPQAKHDMPD
ncbi:class I SAM-dependent methyltransferase [Sphingomonas sp. 37zxx]|uniref:class I SAM-dependent methyltransferase n=1 Tax=Sphingomonas sp. 37zxx TaxID=1550073 RepID=UPI00053BE1CE|nr:methyltransferase domain-containing protein [Sphingomonas sp. 37zxx]